MTIKPNEGSVENLSVLETLTMYTSITHSVRVSIDKNNLK